MTAFTVAPPCDTDPKKVDTRQEAEDARDTHEALCSSCTKGDVEIRNGTENAEPVEAEPVPDQQDPETVETLPDNKPGIEDDPVDWMPSHFIDEIQGVPTLNRKGYAVMAERFNVSVTSEPVVRASETEFQYAEFKATAETEDGTAYSGFGSAHVDRDTGDGGDDPYLLNEMAETRAMKRAASWALGLGMTAKEEME